MNAFSRLSEIVVKDLFGWLSYDIRLNDDISFFVAPNGCGKTTILNMIDFILDPSSGRKLDKFYDIPFDEVSLTFSDGNMLGLKRWKKEDNRIRYFYQKSSGKRKYLKGCIFPYDQRWRESLPFEVEKRCLYIPHSSAIHGFYWPDGKIFTEEERSFITDTMNKFFKPSGKTLRFEENGNYAVMQGKREIEESMLSYGEKYYLNTIMYLTALHDRLVMIDLPETSLHIEWQERFADIVNEILQKNNLQVIITTHSPHIVNGHIEWYADREWTDKRQKVEA